MKLNILNFKFYYCKFISILELMENKTCYINFFILIFSVNFRKYEPPKFDLSNSAVYKLVHNIETNNTGGIANKPEIVSAKEDYYYHKPVI